MTNPWTRHVKIGDCDLYLGDCLEVMPALGKVDAVVTDPPYKLDAPSGQIVKTWARNYYNEMYDKSLDVGLDPRILFFAPHVVAFCSKKQIKDYIIAAENAKYVWTLLTWNKSNPSPLCGNNYLPDTEYIFHCWKGKKLMGNYSTKSRFIVSDVKKTGINHPTVKPEFIMNKFLINSSERGETILDPFMGSGTTLVACAKLGRKGIGIELDPDYFEIACKRVQAAYDQPDLFVAPPTPPTQEGMDL
ncbi:DNA-methylase [Octadecabacter Antarctic DB virus 2]|nr:DNA-methylase [Octadecabacter Antarctic DB virus 2]